MSSFGEWAEAAEEIAYAELALTPKEFEELQPREFYALIRGWKRRAKACDYREAYFVAWMIAPHLKEEVSAERIAAPLWRNPTEERRKAEEDRRILREEFGLTERG